MTRDTNLPNTRPRRVLLAVAAVFMACALPCVFDGTYRTAAFVVTFPTAIIACCLLLATTTLRALVCAGTMTMLGFAVCHAIRWQWRPDAFFGEVPREIALPFHCVVAGTAIVTGTLVYIAFRRRGADRVMKWTVGTLVFMLIASLGGITSRVTIGMTPQKMLQRISTYDAATNPTEYELQEASVFLAACGRATEAESIRRSPRTGVQYEQGVLTEPEIQFAKSHLQPWRARLRQIAQRERLVLIMEAHNAPKHRQWIEQTLPILYDAGFRDYAAETLASPTRSLTLRGYPTAMTGYYSADPSFGNLLRSANQLGFRFHAYESPQLDPAKREEGQAINLAKIMTDNPGMKLVVHAGYAHVYKRNRPGELRTMASYLWEKTGIEPFTIYQNWNSPEETASQQLSDFLAEDEEPRMLIPPPDSWQLTQFDFPDEAIDAVVIHRTSSGGPSSRSHAFPSRRRVITGTWQGNRWPVLITAVRPSESATAVPLDQVLLRTGERRFLLWLPDPEYEFRVFNNGGIVPKGASEIQLDDGSPTNNAVRPLQG